MTLYILYRIGHFISMFFPITISYKIASIIADGCYFFKPSDRIALCNNLRMVLGDKIPDKELNRLAREAFRNFAKYLVDFFRFTKLDKEYINAHVKVEGLGHLDEAKKLGTGVILLSAHIGNWELGGSVLSLIGYPTSAVVLTHKNKLINDFFRRQRLTGKLVPIEMGITLKSCYSILKENGLLALLGDRDFTKNGMQIEFFGKKTLMPKGPALFSYRLGSAIVPAFMLREGQDKYRLIFEKPFFPEIVRSKDSDARGVSRLDEEDRAIKNIAAKYITTMESVIRRYPSQWYVFREVWNNGLTDMRPDTVV